MVFNVAFVLKLYIHHYFTGVIGIFKTEISKLKCSNRRSGEKAHHIYETYEYTVMPHGRHIYAKAYNIAKSTSCIYPQYYNALPHWKFVLWCCDECSYINIPDHETYKNTVMPHGRHIYAKASDMVYTTMCTYPQSDHSFPHYKFLLWCSTKYPCINIPDQ